MQTNPFYFENNDIYFLRMEIKKLISTLSLTLQHCHSMKMISKAKPSERKAEESDLSVSVIPVDESKEEEKTLALSGALAELIIDGENVSEGTILVDNTNKRNDCRQKRKN